MGSERPLRRHVMLVVGGEHPTSYRCSRCAQANPEAVKLFSMRGIRPHVMYTCVSPRFTDIFIYWGYFFFQGISSNRLETTSGPRWS
jgi:hypothetical protein